MRLGIFFLGFILLLLSCGEKIIKEPENLIPQEKMALILGDLAILNSAKGVSPKVLKDYDIDLMPFIFEKHNIDSTQFVQSDLYYASIPLEYQTIYEAVEERLEKQFEIFNKETERERDSLNDVRKAKELKRDSLEKKSKTKARDSLLKK